jgi:DNA polymerase delta subunit 1
MASQVVQPPCAPIASSVTSYGRFLLERNKEFHRTELHHFQRIQATVHKLCYAIFLTPIPLDFEKVYFPYLVVNKKAVLYAGLMWTNQRHYDKVDTKGLEIVRRDKCALIREVIQTSLEKILINHDAPGAADFAMVTCGLVLHVSRERTRM